MSKRLDAKMDYKDFLVDIITTSFEEKIQYDYTMYDAYTTEKFVAKTLVELKKEQESS
jgi:hypothetical protein